jgi:hypothetical protein
MYIVFATYLSVDPRTTLKTLNCLTSPTKDQPNLGKPNEMLSFRSVESTTSTFTDRYTNRKVAAASLYSCRKPGTITSVTTRMVLSTYALHRAGNLAPSLLPSLPCVCLILFLSRLLLCANIQLLSTYRKNSCNLAYCLSSRSLLANSFMHSKLRGFL